MLRKALTLPLLFISASAFAWPSAEEAVKQFIDFELDGGRLSSDSYQEYEKKYAHVPDTHEEGGWDSVIVVNTARIESLTCEAHTCTAKVNFTLQPTAELAGPPPVENDEGGEETVEYTVINKGGDWRVLAVDDYPRISLETYERY